jgi:hypothetical protein
MSGCIMSYIFLFQFSCAAPIDGVNSTGYRDVWVCNSDGYVGHMCLLSLQPEPIVTLNTPVPGCNARILCICAVPSYNGIFKRWVMCHLVMVSGTPIIRIIDLSVGHLHPIWWSILIPSVENIYVLILFFVFVFILTNIL